MRNSMQRKIGHSVFCLLLVSGLSNASALGDKLEVGDQAPGFTATGLDGQAVRFSTDLTGKHRATVLIFSRAHW